MTSPAASPAAPASLAPHHLRLFAFIVDYALAWALIALWNKATLGADWDLRPGRLEGLHPYAWATALAVLLILRDLPGGRSPGKWIAGVAVTRAAVPGTRPSLVQAVVRNLSLLVFPVDAVLVFVDPYYRRLGDRLAGTVTVVPPATVPLYRRLILLSVLVLAFSLAFTLVMRWNVFRSAVYRTAREAVRTNPAVVEALGQVEDVGADPKIEPDKERPNRAIVTLEAEGSRGDATVEVSLHLDPALPAWEVESVRLVEAPPRETRPEPAPERQQ